MDLFAFAAIVAIVVWLFVNAVSECQVGDPAGRFMRFAAYVIGIALIVWKSGLIGG